MIDRDIDIQTTDGAMNTFITHPEEGGPHPVVFFLMDAPGKREELHDMARRLGTAGYYVMLPNLYYRRVREFTMTPDNRETMFEHMRSLSIDMACSDMQTMFDFAARDAAAGDGKAGCVGYCMSGPFAFSAASRFPDRIAAAASIHGVRLISDAEDSPHREAHRIRGEMYFACAETDEFAPQKMIEDLGEFLDGVDIDSRIEWYPGTEHGWVFPTRGAKYDKASAERHWERLLAMFRRCL
ncbi:MAG TPA: dienelactone hydrolase family protein [Burkholderiales bacterium]|nr:dienelactone hydrolase family protein [Burkholderiales bacterium]